MGVLALLLGLASLTTIVGSYGFRFVPHVVVLCISKGHSLSPGPGALSPRPPWISNLPPTVASDAQFIPGP
jgi:hypothetical protein